MSITTAEGILTSLLPEWQLLLQGWSANGSLVAAAQEALMLQDEPPALTDLVTQWSEGDFTGIPPIVLLSSADISGAMGAYAISTGTIYLNADWLATASKEQVFAVLTEELGHHLDGLLNAVDTPGDEGEYFAKLLSGQGLSESAKIDLRKQNDWFYTKTGGGLVTAENATNVLADSERDFSGTQGSTNWYYGYYDSDLKASSFKQFNWFYEYYYQSTLVSIWLDTGSDYYTRLDRIGGHPHGPISTRPLQVEQWAVRRWVSNYDGLVRISGNINDINRGGGGDGITGRIIVSGNEVLACSINNSGPANGINYSIELTVTKGQHIDFAIDPNAWDGDDSTRFTATITAATPVIRGNSLYTIVVGPSWNTAEENALAKGGHLATIEDEPENQFLISAYAGVDTGTGLWIGLTDQAQEGNFQWSSGSNSEFRKWDYSQPDNSTYFSVLGQDYAYIAAKGNAGSNTQGYWDDSTNEERSISGIAEIALTSSITLPTAPREGGGIFTTSVNLSAGTQTSGNLAEGAQVWWKVTGISADDLNSGALTGTGVITNGQLQIQHSLKKDADTSEQFQVSVYSDSGMSQQIGTMASIGVIEAPPSIRGNSLYTIVDGPSWTQAETNAMALGGHLVAIGSEEENSFIWKEYGKNYWIGFTDEGSEGEWRWSSGEVVTYTNWSPGNPNNYWGTQNYAWFWTDTPGMWDDLAINQEIGSGYAELSLNSSVTFTNAKEGETLTTTINLSTGTYTRTDLVEGAVVFYKITGITTDDLESSSPNSLTGSGKITNGQLILSHQLKADLAIENENFEISLFSDASMTSEYQIGSAKQIAVVDANSNPTDITISPGLLNENIAVDSVIATLGSVDLNTGDSFGYTLVPGASPNDNTLFTITGNQLKINASPDFETKPSYSIRIRTTDLGGLFFEKNFTLNVNNLQEGGSIGALTSSIFNGLSFVEGVTLTAGAVTDPDKVSSLITYNWYKGTTLVQSGGSNTYVVGPQGLGDYRIEAVYTDGTGSTVTAASSSQPVGKSDNGFATFQLQGTTAVDQTLSVQQLTSDPDGAGTISYQWQSGSGSSWTNVGTNAPTYKVVAGDEGKQIQVVVTAVDAQGYNKVTTFNAGSVPLSALTINATGTNNTFIGTAGYDGLIRSGDLVDYTISGSISSSLIESITSVTSGKTTSTVVTTLDSLTNIESVQINAGTSNNTIRAGGISTNGITRSAFTGTLIAFGGTGVDTITGGNFKNWLGGQGFAAGVTSGIETITGTTNTAGGAMDVFDLRNAARSAAAYVGGGNSDYARVSNFNAGTDKLVLTGSASNYTFALTQVINSKTKAVTDQYWAVSTSGGDLIAQVRGSLTNFSAATSVLYGTGDQTTFGLGF
jgi:hypothetical protein